MSPIIWFLLIVILVGCSKSGSDTENQRAVSEEPPLITWCNFTDLPPHRSIQGPTGGFTSAGRSWGTFKVGSGLPELEYSSVQEQLEKRLGVRIRAFGGPTLQVGSPLYRLFGSPGDPRPQAENSTSSVQAIPDVFPYGWWCAGAPANERVAQSNCAALTRDEIEKYMPGLVRAIKSAAFRVGEESLWSHFEVGGQIIWLPLNVRESYGGRPQNPTGVLWRMDILVDLGLPVPATIDEWEEVFRAYRLRYPDKTPWIDDLNMWSWRSVYTATGVPYGNWIAEKQQVSPWWVQPEIRDALATLQQWYAEGFIDGKPPPRSGRASVEAFVRGQSIVADQVKWEFGNWVTTDPLMPGSLPYWCRQQQEEATFVLSPSPRYRDVPKLRLPLESQNVVWGQFAFAKRLEEDRDHLHLVMAVIDRIASDQKLFLLAYRGIEGTHWSWQEAEGTEYPEPTQTDLPREVAGPGRYWTHAFYGLYPDFRTDPRILISRDRHGRGAGALYGEERNTWNEDPRKLIAGVDAETQRRLYETERILYEEYEKMQARIVQGGEPVELFSEYLMYWNENGGPDLVAEINHLGENASHR